MCPRISEAMNISSGNRSLMEFRLWKRKGRRCVWTQPALFLCVFLPIFFNDDVGDLFGRSFTAPIEPFLYDGGDAGREEFDVIIDVAGVLVEGGGSPCEGVVFYEDVFEIETEFEIDLIEDLVVFDVLEEFEELETVLRVL